MKVAVSGGYGLVGAAVCAELGAHGHEVVPLSRRNGNDVGDVQALTAAFEGCNAVIHAAGINRETGSQTYDSVHVQGARNLVTAARAAGVRQVVLVSFLRARPGCGSGYHESKFAAEEIVRESGLDYTIFKPGVIYGRGDHMLDHLSRAFRTFPVFGFVGFTDQNVAPMHVHDFARLLTTAITDDRLRNRTFAAVGPETLTLRKAVLRVAQAVGRNPFTVRLPIWIHKLVAVTAEAFMREPVVSRAQVRILSEGVVDPASDCDLLPDDLRPTTAFTEEPIRKGLPEPSRYGFRDLRCPCWF